MSVIERSPPSYPSAYDARIGEGEPGSILARKTPLREWGKDHATLTKPRCLSSSSVKGRLGSWVRWLRLSCGGDVLKPQMTQQSEAAILLAGLDLGSAVAEL